MPSRLHLTFLLPLALALTQGASVALAAPAAPAAAEQRNLVARCEKDGKIRRVYVRADRRELQTDGDVEPELASKIRQFLDAGRRIDAVAYAPDCEGWTVVAGTQSFTRNIGSSPGNDYYKEINRLNRDGRRIRAVAFNPDDWATKHGFVIAYDDAFVARGLPGPFTTRVTSLLQRTRKPIDAIAFSDLGDLGWSVVSGTQHETSASFGRGDYVSALNALLGDGRGVDSLSTVVGERAESESWLIASRTGYAASMLTSIAHVRFPEGQPRTVESHTFSKDNPALVVFLHGITGEIADEPGQKINTAEHVAHYWGPDFLQATLGGVPGAKLWLYHTDGAREEITRAQLLAWNAGKKKRRGLLLSTVDSSAIDEVRSYLTGMVAWRDGSRPLGLQARDQVRQIYAHYMTHFSTRKNTELVLLGHSAGGIVARIILSARETSKTGLYSEWTHEDKQMARFLATRTRFAVTMASPHDGSPIPAFSISGGPNQFNVPYCKKLLGNKAIDAIDTGVKTTLGVCEEIPLIGGACGEVKSAWDKANVDSLDRFCGALPDAVRGLMSGDDPVLKDLTFAAMQRVNGAELAPQRATRLDGSLVPFYVLGGRSPVRSGHRCWGASGDCSGPVDAAALLEDLTVASGKLGKVRAQLPPAVRERVESSALVVTAGLAAMTPPGFGFGRAEHTWLDKVKQRGAPFARFSAGTDKNVDYDGFVGIDSSLGYRLGTPFDPKSALGKFYFDHSREYPLDGALVRGSWYRLTTGPWDYHNHGLIMFPRDSGKWLYDHLLRRNVAGPFVGGDDYSDWAP